MVVCTPYHYQSCQNQSVPTTISQNMSTAQRDLKKRKVLDKTDPDDKSGNVNLNQTVIPHFKIPCAIDRSEFTNSCGCKKRKCSKHCTSESSKKTPEEVVLQIKHHIVKILSLGDVTPYCKVDQQTKQVDVDISKLHLSYLEEHEPQAAKGLDSSQENKDVKPKVKKWLYRKLFLDEFKSFELTFCKNHLDYMMRNLDSAVKYKKKSPKHKVNMKNNHSQDFSNNTQTSSKSLISNTRRPNTIGSSTASSTTPSYQNGVMTVNDTSIAPTSSNNVPPTLHNSVVTYMNQPVPVHTNLIFGIGHQPSSSTQQQQQPLNLQTSHLTSPNIQAPPNSQPHQLSVQQHSSATPSPIPLNLHNPYYVSFGPMLPLHMTSPQHNHQSQFQPNIMQPQPSLQPQPHFNQHIMYQ